MERGPLATGSQRRERGVDHLHNWAGNHENRALPHGDCTKIVINFDFPFRPKIGGQETPDSLRPWLPSRATCTDDFAVRSVCMDWQSSGTSIVSSAFDWTR